MTARSKIAPEKMARLNTFLASLPVSVAAKLFAVLEIDFATGTPDLPHREMLSTLRHRLFEQNADLPTRPLTAQRVFFQPFEDFFVPERKGRKRRARIARASIGPIWKLVNEDSACVNVASAAASLDQLLKETLATGKSFDPDHVDVASLTDRLFSAASEGFGRILSHADGDDNYRSDLAERLGGSTNYHDLLELHLMLSAVNHIKKTQSAFQKPIAPLTEEQKYTVRKLYAAAYAEAPNSAAYVLLCLAARMDAPWRVMSVFYHLKNAEDSDLTDAQEDAKVILEVLFDDIESMARAMERNAERDFHAAEAELMISHFVEFADGMQQEAARHKDTVSINRIEACRDLAAGALERFTEQSAAAVRLAMPVRHAGGSSRLMALRPDIDRIVSPTLAREGREAADFLARIEETTRKLNRQYQSGSLIEDAKGHAAQYANDLVTEIRAAEGDERSAARRLMDQTLTLITPLLSADQVGLIRERARIAAQSA